jgi:hypothetical protein
MRNWCHAIGRIPRSRRTSCAHSTWRSRGCPQAAVAARTAPRADRTSSPVCAFSTDPRKADGRLKALEKRLRVLTIRQKGRPAKREQPSRPRFRKSISTESSRRGPRSSAPRGARYHVVDGRAAAHIFFSGVEGSRIQADVVPSCEERIDHVHISARIYVSL